VLSRRPIRPELASFAVAAFTATALNVAFWQRLYAAVAPRDAFEFLFVAAVFVVALCLLTLVFDLLATRRLFKPVAIVVLLVGSAAAYFINEYGIVIDVNMLNNVLETNRGEAGDLLSPKLALYLLGLGVAPSVLLWLQPIAYRTAWQEVRLKLGAVPALLGIAALIALPFTQNVSSVFRQNRVLLDAFVPYNLLSAAGEYARKRIRVTAVQMVPIAGDAHKAAAWAKRTRNSLTVIVVGETARARNFSLNGYERETNPLLAKVPGLISLTQVFSCGTDTAQSLPCMFSALGRGGFTIDRAARQDGLLDMLQRVGFSVLWRENQGGCKRVCKGVPTEAMAGAGNRALFELGESFDETLLHGLQEKVAAMPGHAVVVLHMMGSHGPAYYKRYPAAFEHFRPACKESQFSRCATSEIVNSYDNTLVYTDYVLAKLLELLQARDAAGSPTAMIYLSDHGESLGESNMYLHGMPYAFAPDVQKHIPMLLWLSPKYQQDFQVDAACLGRRRHEALSHDNLFHSVLGLLDVRANIYREQLDLFARCRSTPD
jgi:lipid A ethanolaminephosphotransferase